MSAWWRTYLTWCITVLFLQQYCQKVNPEVSVWWWTYLRFITVLFLQQYCQKVNPEMSTWWWTYLARCITVLFLQQYCQKVNPEVSVWWWTYLTWCITVLFLQQYCLCFLFSEGDVSSEGDAKTYLEVGECAFFSQRAMFLWRATKRPATCSTNNSTSASCIFQQVTQPTSVLKNIFSNQHYLEPPTPIQ